MSCEQQQEKLKKWILEGSEKDDDIYCVESTESDED